MKYNYVTEVLVGADWKQVPPLSVKLDRSMYWWNKAPSASVSLDNKDGANRVLCAIARRVRITRNGIIEYTGIINTPVSEINDSEAKLDLSTKDLFTDRLTNKTCNGPLWNFKDADPRDVLRAMIGTLTIAHEYFTNMALIDTSTMSNVCVLDAVMQLAKNGSVYQASGSYQSTALANNDWASNTQGTVNSLSIVINGVNNGTITLEVSRDNGATYYPVTLTWTGAYWSGAYTFAGSESIRNKLRYKLTLNAGAGNATTPLIDNIRINASTDSDVGMSEGLLEAWSNPYEANNYITYDYTGAKRYAGIAAVQKVTSQDIYADGGGNLHALNHRGSTLSKTFTVGTDVKVLNRKQEREPMANAIEVTGAGWSNENITFKIKASFEDQSSIGLYERIEKKLNAPDIKDQGTLNAYTYVLLHSKMKVPYEYIKGTIIDGRVIGYGLGDNVTVTDGSGTTGVNGSLRITEESRSWSTDGGETVDLVFSTRDMDNETLAKAFIQQVTSLMDQVQPSGYTSPATWMSDCDKDTPCEAPVYISPNREVKQIILNLFSKYFQSTSTGAASGGGSSKTSTNGSTGHAHVFDTGDHHHVLNFNGGTTSYPVYLSNGTLYSNGSGPVSTSSAGNINVTSSGGGDQHTHVVNIDNHLHSLEFGIYKFGYAAPVTLRVNSPTATPYGAFGVMGSESELFTCTGLDITALFDPAGGSGKLEPGKNNIYIVTQATANNPKGLLRIYCTVEVIYKS